MFSRIRIAFGLALLLTLITSITVFAKGGFSFITITGPNLKDSVRVTESALTTDFFALADFFRDSTEAPDDPGAGYKITRYYLDGGREVAFDYLHYYPDVGLVYYDGIVNGSSEYDGEWYIAKPKIGMVFENALSNQPQSVPAITQGQRITSLDPTQSSTSILQTPYIILIAVTAGLAVILALAFWFRRLSTR
jgi:hypothetical protein